MVFIYLFFCQSTYSQKQNIVLFNNIKMHSIHLWGMPHAPLHYAGQELSQVLSQPFCIFISDKLQILE